MKINLLRLFTLLFTTTMFAQSGHIMQGVGAANMSMGGAATGQPLDISGALHWNPAAISTFDEKSIKFDLGLFFSSPELFSTVPEFDTSGQPTGNFFSGNTEDDRGVSPMPALAMVWGKEDSKHTFGASAFGISGFGVTFPESMTNPINTPQPNGFGRIESDYILLQIGFAWAYEFSDKFSLGVQPNFNYATLQLEPNPTTSPGAEGYPKTDKATATGFGAQFGLFFDSGSGFKAGASYKTTQNFNEFNLDNSSGPNNKFDMDYPSILSFGLGYSNDEIDVAVDYRMVNYENTNGFEASGWTFDSNMLPSVAGFGWENISIISAGLQYKGVDKLPLRLGYTYSSNPIPDELAFFNIPATAIIKNAFQFGLSYEVSESWRLDGVFHYGASGDKTSGEILNPMFISESNPLGAIPGSEAAYDMNTSMVQFGVSYTFNTKEAK